MPSKDKIWICSRCVQEYRKKPVHDTRDASDARVCEKCGEPTTGDMYKVDAE